MSTQPAKYQAVSIAESRFGPRKAIAPVSNANGGAARDKPEVMGAVLEVVCGAFDYLISIVPISSNKHTSSSTILRDCVMLTMGNDKKDAPPQVQELIKKKRSASDAGKAIPKDRLLPTEPENLKFLLNTTEMRVCFDKGAVESAVDIPNDLKSGKSDSAAKIKEIVLNALKPGTIISFIDTDPTFYTTKSETSPDTNILNTKLNSRTFRIESAPTLPTPAVGQSLETVLNLSPHFNHALVFQLLSCRALLNGDSSVNANDFYEPVLQCWTQIASVLNDMIPRMHLRQPHVDRLNDHFKGGSKIISDGLQTFDSNSSITKLDVYRELIKKGYLQEKLSYTVVHNPAVKSNLNEILYRMMTHEIEDSSSMPSTLVTYSIHQVQIKQDSELVIVHMLPSLIRCKEELEHIATNSESTTNTFFANNGAEEAAADMCIKLRLSTLSAIFGGLPRGLTEGLANQLYRLPFVATLRSNITDISVAANDFVNTLRFDVMTILKQRAPRVSEEWIKTNACDEDGNFLQPNDDTSFTHEFKPREKVKAPYTNFVTDHFVCPMIGGTHDTPKKIEKDLKKIAKNEGNDQLKVYYAILPLCAYDPETFPMSTKDHKITMAEREEYVNEMIKSHSEGDSFVAQVHNFFTTGKGIVYAFVA